MKGSYVLDFNFFLNTDTLFFDMISIVLPQLDLHAVFPFEAITNIKQFFQVTKVRTHVVTNKTHQVSM